MPTMSDHARATALAASRVMYPHDNLPDEAYEKVVNQIEADAQGDESIAPTIDQGIAQLDEGGTAFAELDADAQLERLTAAEGSPFFNLLRATAVVELYDNPLVWKAFGYEGASAHLGGYTDRGFNDLDWLPEPHIESPTLVQERGDR